MFIYRKTIEFIANLEPKEKNILINLSNLKK